MSNGALVRESGIVALASCSEDPTESTDRYFAPSKVLILIATVLRSPMNAFLTLKVTFTLSSPVSATVSTLPTFTPAMRTSSPDRRFASSVKYAEYDVPPPINGKDSALNAAHNKPRISTRPIAPIVVGLRELNGLPPTLTRRVVIRSLTGSDISGTST